MLARPIAHGTLISILESHSGINLLGCVSKARCGIVPSQSLPLFLFSPPLVHKISTIVIQNFPCKSAVTIIFCNFQAKLLSCDASCIVIMHLDAEEYS
jgi:hypothetical protein